MSISLILAVTFVPLVLVIALLGLAFAWLRMHRARRDDVVDLVELQKEAQAPITTEDNYEVRKSTEPFPRLPSMDLHDTGDLIDSSYGQKQGKSYDELQRIAHHPTEPLTIGSQDRSNALSTPPKRPISLAKSPSREALAAFDFDTPPKPPLPTRSLKRASSSKQTPITTATPPRPSIKIEPASPSSASATSDKIQPLHLSPAMIGRAHARRTIEIATNKGKDNDNDSVKPIPFSSVPITHIQSPTSDDLPPTPTRASTYLSNPYIPKDVEGLQAMMANREMMEIEAWRPDKAAALRTQKSGVNMHGKRNSAIREYVRNFPEQNPWRKMIARRSRDVQGSAEEGLRGEEEDFMKKFGGGRWE